MTIVFRTSTFFLVVVISLKTFSAVGSSLLDTRTSGFGHRVEQLLNESLRHRKELDEVAEEGTNMVQALCSITGRSIRLGARLAIRSFGRAVQLAKRVTSVSGFTANPSHPAARDTGLRYSAFPLDGKPETPLWPNLTKPSRTALKLYFA